MITSVTFQLSRVLASLRPPSSARIYQTSPALSSFPLLPRPWDSNNLTRPLSSPQESLSKITTCMHEALITLAFAIALRLSTPGEIHHPAWAEPPRIHGPNLHWDLSADAHLTFTCSLRSPFSKSLGEHSKYTLLFQLSYPIFRPLYSADKFTSNIKAIRLRLHLFPTPFLHTSLHPAPPPPSV